MSIIHESFTDISLLDDKFFDSFKNLKSYEELKIAIENTIIPPWNDELISALTLI